MSTASAGEILSVPALIVGNGAAAWHAVKGLREAGYRGVVHLLSDHGEPVYSPMLLAYYVRDALPRERCFPFGASLDIYERAGVVFHGADPVAELDASRRLVSVESGARYRYQVCVVATGASPVGLSVPGAGSSRIHLLRTMEQAERLREALRNGARRVLVVGASMVGMKVTEAMVERGLDVVVCDEALQVLPFAAHPDCAAILAQGLVERGVLLRLGRQIESFEERESGIRAHMRPSALLGGGADGSVEVDVVVAAVGVRPNVDFVVPAQTAVGTGLAVDRCGRADTGDLFAAGDCAQTYDPDAGRHVAVGLWAAACYQGRAVGRNMARMIAGELGALEAAPTVPVHNVIHFLDWVFVSIGEAGRATDVVGPADVCDPARDLYYRLAMEDGRVAGVNLLNCCDAAGILRHAATRGRTGGREANLRMEWPRFMQAMRRAGAEGPSGAV